MISDNFVKLDDISREYFGLGKSSALTKARLGTLPVPAVRLTDSQKAPWFAAKDVLEACVAICAGQVGVFHHFTAGQALNKARAVSALASAAPVATSSRCKASLDMRCVIP